MAAALEKGAAVVVHEDVRPSHALQYLTGFGNEHASEALPGALPVGQNSPQRCSYGLYAEQLSGTAFTVPRKHNRRSWLYRIRPAVIHGRFVPCENPAVLGSFGAALGPHTLDPNQMRWLPPPLPKPSDRTDWLSGLFTVAGAGAAEAKHGLAIHLYTCNASMIDTAMVNADGEMLIVPQEGTLHVQSEMGWLNVPPGEICVMPRGVRFRVAVDGPSRGYVLEVFQSQFELPELGPLGANGLANPRDFQYPVAAWEDREVDYVIVSKFGGHMFSTVQHHSPFDVVAWHGNLSPYKYNLARFCTMNTVSFDHADPSIYTVLTAQSDTPGVAVADFVIFPPRWMVMEHSFRPPYYHRNCMSEYMGMIWGKYDAKVGFQPGGSSLHSIMTPHGPDAETFVKASNADALLPDKFSAGLAFMFETSHFLRVTDVALGAPWRDREYQKCWSALPKVFDPARRDVSDVKYAVQPPGPAFYGVTPGVAAPVSHGTRGEAAGALAVGEDGASVQTTSTHGRAAAAGGAGAGDESMG